MDINFHLQQLKSCELFKDLSDLELQYLYQSMSQVKLSSGEVLFSQGEVSDCMYIVLRGRLLVIKEERVIAQVGRGQTVGEMGIIANEARSATIIAMRESLLLKLDQAHFSELWSRYPRVLFEITKIITQRLQKTLTPRQKHNNASNILVLQANQQTNMKLFIEQLEASFDRQLRYKVIRRTDFPPELSEEQLHLYIQDLENHCDYLFFEIPLHDKNWLFLCLGYADRILVLADGSQSVNYDPAILPLLTKDGIHSEIKRILILLYESQSTKPINTDAWLRPIPFFRHYHVHFNRREDFLRLLRLINGTAIGLVLSGGAARCWAHIGVAKYIYEQNIPIDAFAGTSAGAGIAASMAVARDYQDLVEICEYFEHNIKFTEYTIPFCSLLSSKSITVAVKNVYKELKIEDLERIVICVAADLYNSEEVDIQTGFLWLATRASTAIPGIYPPVYIPDSQRLLIDGGVINNLPVDVMRNYFEGLGKIIAIDISETFSQSIQYNYPLELTWPAIIRQKIFSNSKLNIPSITNIFLDGLMLSTVQKTKMNASLSDIYLKPQLTNFPFLDSSRKQQLIEIGYACAEKILNNWKIDLKLTMEHL